VIVREAETGDELAAVTASAIATLRHTYRPTAAAIARARPSRRLVAVARGEIVGTLEYDGGHVVGLFVHADHRRRGVARALLAALGPRELSLFTIRETGNVPIFVRLGFAVVREELATDYVSDVYAQLHEVHMLRAAF
jgi:GNAT superfamily N-acetyltransferase